MIILRGDHSDGMFLYVHGSDILSRDQAAEFGLDHIVSNIPGRVESRRAMDSTSGADKTRDRIRVDTRRLPTPPAGWEWLIQSVRPCAQGSVSILPALAKPATGWGDLTVTQWWGMPGVVSDDPRVRALRATQRVTLIRE